MAATARRIALFGLVLLGWNVGVGHAQPPTLQLVETWPVETTLDDPQIPDAYKVWPEMIDSAKSTLDFAQFYASDHPDSRLGPVVEAIRQRAQAGVQVRFLADRVFHDTYPETLDLLESTPNIEVRLFDGRQHVGGVLHAKYFVVDESQAYLGSQNFDWRALEHIHEMGLRISQPRLVRTLRAEFEADWARSGQNENPPPFTETWQENEFVDVGNGVRARPAFSSDAAIRTGEVWDLPQIVGLLDSAQERVRIQLLTYSAVGRDKTYWDGLESALRSAAARGVEVQMAIAHWGQRAGVVEGLQSLQCLPNIEIKFATIPEWSGGYISFARVIHAKYLVVDGTRGWIGTSNWEKSYFFAGRNVGLVFEGAALGQQLNGVFKRLWDSEYTETVDPSRNYPAPQFGEQG